MTSEFGTFRLTFTPPEDRSPDYPSIAIDMSMDGEASVSDMLHFFEAFLQASGYVLKGDLKVVEPEKDFDPYLQDPIVSGGENPYSVNIDTTRHRNVVSFS